MKKPPCILSVFLRPVSVCLVRIFFVCTVMTRFISASVVWGNATKGHVVQLVLGIVFLLTSFASAMYTSDGVNPVHVDSTSRKLYTAKEFFNFWYFGVVTMSTGEQQSTQQREGFHLLPLCLLLLLLFTLSASGPRQCDWKYEGERVSLLLSLYLIREQSHGPGGHQSPLPGRGQTSN